jgi:hypothetical protein
LVLAVLDETRGGTLTSRLLYFLPLIAFPVLSISACQKATLDNEVDRLCIKDGGITVHEVVIVPDNQFTKYGERPVFEKRLAKPADEFYYVSEVLELKSGNPSLSRNHHKIVRRSDQKVVGEGVSYLRRGGDVPGPWHESSHLCPAEASPKHIALKVFRSEKGLGK